VSEGDLCYEVLPQRTLGSLVLPREVEDACKELIEEQQQIRLLRGHNLEPRHRVLLTGPSGNGKSAFAEALATELMLPLLVARYEAVAADYWGETAARLARLFHAVQARQAVLLLDNWGSGAGWDSGGGSPLLRVDTVPSHVVVVVATNRPGLLSGSVWRRFQLRFHLPPPTPEQTEAWFEERLGVKVGLSELAKTEGLASFADLEALVVDVRRRDVLVPANLGLDALVAERIDRWLRRRHLGVTS